MFSVNQLEDSIIEFRRLLKSKIGPESVTSKHQLRKLEEEVVELQEAVEALAAEDTPDSQRGFVEELADVIIVALMAGACEGVWVEDVLDAASFKMNKNLSRLWELNEDGVAHHYEEAGK